MAARAVSDANTYPPNTDLVGLRPLCPPGHAHKVSRVNTDQRGRLNSAWGTTVGEHILRPRFQHPAWRASGQFATLPRS